MLVASFLFVDAALGQMMPGGVALPGMGLPGMTGGAAGRRAGYDPFSNKFTTNPLNGLPCGLGEIDCPDAPDHMPMAFAASQMFGGQQAAPAGPQMMPGPAVMPGPGLMPGGQASFLPPIPAYDPINNKYNLHPGTGLPCGAGPLELDCPDAPDSMPFMYFQHHFAQNNGLVNGSFPSATPFGQGMGMGGGGMPGMSIPPNSPGNPGLPHYDPFSNKFITNPYNGLPCGVGELDCPDAPDGMPYFFHMQNAMGGGMGGAPSSMVGADADTNGCRASAGYSWCEATGSCIRTWETDCPSTPAVLLTRAHAESVAYQFAALNKFMDAANGPDFPFMGPFTLKASHVPLFNTHCNAAKDPHQCEQFVFCTWTSNTCGLDNSKVVIQKTADSQTPSSSTSKPLSPVVWASIGVVLGAASIGATFLISQKCRTQRTPTEHILLEDSPAC